MGCHDFHCLCFSTSTSIRFMKWRQRKSHTWDSLDNNADILMNFDPSRGIKNHRIISSTDSIKVCQQLASQPYLYVKYMNTNQDEARIGCVLCVCQQAWTESVGVWGGLRAAVKLQWVHSVVMVTREKLDAVGFHHHTAQLIRSEMLTQCVCGGGCWGYP